ncbi:MAG: hypothetical protein OEV85_04540 [Candidatus Thorarchaeota archaeon]|nr:hypothetical protein [Candidatus Thorarchaeota archaeon]
MSTEPSLTPSSISSIPSHLKMTLLEILSRYEGKGRKGILISSNSLANKFIHLQWNIRPTQRRQYRNLFLAVREECRSIFQYYINNREVIYQEHGTDYKFRVYKFDEVRGNLILGFVYIDPNSL